MKFRSRSIHLGCFNSSTCSCAIITASHRHTSCRRKALHHQKKIAQNRKNVNFVWNYGYNCFFERKTKQVHEKVHWKIMKLDGLFVLFFITRTEKKDELTIWKWSRSSDYMQQKFQFFIMSTFVSRFGLMNIWKLSKALLSSLLIFTLRQSSKDYNFFLLLTMRCETSKKCRLKSVRVYNISI